MRGLGLWWWGCGVVVEKGGVRERGKEGFGA